MNKKNFSKLFLSLQFYVNIAFICSCPLLARGQSDSSSSARPMEEVVVTARKREENILETPLSVSVFSGESLDKKGIISFNDMFDATPGLSSSSVSNGRNDRSWQQISTRGMTPSTPDSTLTATFVNGVPVASAAALNSLSDPERIEILKGPQSTQFGRNAFAGAINLVTKAPAEDFGGWLSAELGQRDSYDVAASVSGPILADGLLSFRASGNIWERGGSYKNHALNERDEALGTRKTHMASLALSSEVNDRLQIQVTGFYIQDDDGPSAEGVLSAYEIRANQGAFNIPALSGSNDGQVILSGMTNCDLLGFESGLSADEGRVNNPFLCGELPDLPAGQPAANTIEDDLLSSLLADPSNRIHGNSVDGYGLHREYWHLQGVITLDLNDSLTLRSATGRNLEFVSELDDLDSYDTSLIANASAALIPGAREVWNFPFLVEHRDEDLSQEFRVDYDGGGAVQWMLGTSYLNAERQTGLSNFWSQEQFLGSRAADNEEAPKRAETYGVFASLNYDFSQRLGLSLEGRWQRDEIYLFTGGAGVSFSDDNPFDLPARSYAPFEKIISKRFENFLPRVILDFQASDDIFIYASWAEAANILRSSFNSQFLGGSSFEREAGASIGLGAVVEPERLENYEVGLKGSAFDQRITGSIAAYKARWNQQHNNRTVTAVDDTTEPPAVTIVTGVANTGASDLHGLEFDLSVQAIDALLITFSAALNESSYDSFSDPQVSQLTGLIDTDFRGNQLPRSSKYSSALSFEYSGSLPSGNSWFIRSDTNYKSKQYLDAANLVWVGDRHVTNLRLGVELSQNIKAEMFVLNLLDNQEYLSGSSGVTLTDDFSLTGTLSHVMVALPQRRYIGASLKWNF